MFVFDGIPVPIGLRLVESYPEEGYSWLQRTDGSEFCYHHTTGNLLVDLSELDLDALWRTYLVENMGRSRAVLQARFVLDYLPTRTHEPPEDLAWCLSCGEPGLPEVMMTVNGGLVCEPCDENYRTCDSCIGRFHEDDTTYVEGEVDVCDSCRSSYYNWCEGCEVYYRDGSSNHSHDGSGCCTSPELGFAIRNDGHGMLDNDEEVTITTPDGVISEVGLEAIACALREHAYRPYVEVINDPATSPAERVVAAEQYDKWCKLSYDLDEIGDEWVAEKGGNFTKRLSKLAYKSRGLKLPAELLSTIGNIGAQHSTGFDLTVAVTRDLNLSPEEFANGDSCWWGGYSSSRCALKTNGGFGLRSFVDAALYHGGTTHVVSGRAWVLPLRLTYDGKLVPTFNTVDPAAFVVFNGYEALPSLTAARLLAQMQGMTYRRIEFKATPMYINSGVGYLVAPEEVAAPYTRGSLHLALSDHANLYATEAQTIAGEEAILAARAEAQDFDVNADAGELMADLPF